MSMLQTMEAIKQKELHIKHLRAILSEARAENKPTVFLINRELKAQQARGKELVAIYNKKVQEHKAQQQMVKTFNEREIKNLRLRMLREIVEKWWSLIPRARKWW